MRERQLVAIFRVSVTIKKRERERQERKPKREGKSNVSPRKHDARCMMKITITTDDVVKKKKDRKRRTMRKKNDEEDALARKQKERSETSSIHVDVNGNHHSMTDDDNMSNKISIFYIRA